MALGFIKKVFTFGKERSTDVLAPELVEEQVRLPEERVEQPLRPEDIEAAEALAAKADLEADAEPAILPSAGQLSDLGVVPLSLLEAESE